jgi:hypothetical protein
MVIAFFTGSWFFSGLMYFLFPGMSTYGGFSTAFAPQTGGFQHLRHTYPHSCFSFFPSNLRWVRL